MSQETMVDAADQNNATHNTSDNLSHADLEAQLVSHILGQDNETQNSPDSEEEIEEETEEVDNEIESEEEEEAQESEEEESEHEQDVLSQYDVDWESIPQEHAKEMNRRLGGRFHKRLDQQTAIIKQLEAKLEDAQQNESSDASTGELAEIDNLDALQNLERDLTKRSRDINKILRRSEQISDDGDEYLYEEDGVFYSRDQVENWLDATEGQLEKLPDRKQQIAELEKKRETSNKMASQIFPELDDPDSVYSERYESLKSNPEYKQLFKLPNAKYLAGMLFLAEQVIAKSNNAQQPTPKKAAKQRPKAPVPSSGIAPARQTSTAKQQKAIAQAQARFNETGSLADLQALEELKVKFK
jgi:cell division septation protein DedD